VFLSMYLRVIGYELGCGHRIRAFLERPIGNQSEFNSIVVVVYVFEVGRAPPAISADEAKDTTIPRYTGIKMINDVLITSPPMQTPMTHCGRVVIGCAHC